jgi:hypothetical protein
MIFAQRFPPSFSILKGIFNFIGCLLSSPVLWLFFRAYHEIVPLIFVGQSSHSRPASESDPEFSLPVAA